jgi:uncharacterized membrane protein
MWEDWLHYGLRMFHLIAGIMWIGTSFYFVWLDSSFLPEEKPEAGNPDAPPSAVEGVTYMVHGGFFYRVEKQRPLAMPKVLHWFKYEALLTWVSGVFLLGLVYWTGGGLALVDPLRFPMHPHVAKTVSVMSMVVGWAVYDLLWKFVGARATRLAQGLSLVLLFGSIFALCYVFPGRAAFIHVGAMLGTIMIANVWMRILPAQRRMIAASVAGQTPDWAQGQAAKQRSLHNSYLTIPVLLTMVSNHFSFAFDHPQAWVVLSLLVVVGAAVRHLMITIEKQQPAHWTWGPLVAGLAGLMLLTAPKAAPVDKGPPVAFAQANDILVRRCYACHSKSPTDDVFKTAPNGVMLDTPDAVVALAPRIRLRAVEAKSMPLGNKTAMTEEERVLLGRWIDQGAHTQ